MKSEFSKTWVSSKQPRKQRKYRANAPKHIRRKMIASPLSKDLKKQYKKRNIPVRKGDRVKVLRGKFKDTIGEIDKVDMKTLKIQVKGAEVNRGEGRTVARPIDPSNVVVLTINKDDKLRMEALKR